MRQNKTLKKYISVVRNHLNIITETSFDKDNFQNDEDAALNLNNQKSTQMYSFPEITLKEDEKNSDSDIYNFFEFKEEENNKEKLFDKIDNIMSNKSNVNSKVICEISEGIGENISLKAKIQKNQINNKKKGRPGIKEVRNGKHNIFSEDNIMRKIKSHFFKYVNKTLNQAIAKKRHKFVNIPYVMVKELNIDYNIQLMNSTIKEVYEESYQYIDTYKIKNRKRIQRNKATMNYLSKNEKDETNVINLLNLNVIQFYYDFRENCLELFLTKISQKIKDENREKYKEKVRRLCNNFEKWFLDRKPRTKKKNK